MMGLSGDGGYNDANYKLTLAGEDYSARVEIAQDEIVRRVREMGITGLAAHGADKLSYIFGDGLYYASMKLDIGNVHKGNPLQAYFVQGMPHTGRAVYAALGMQTALLAGPAAGPPGHGAACGGAGADAVFAFVGGAQPLSAEFFAGDAGSGLPRS